MTTRPPKREWHGTHHSWSYRPHAFRWDGELIAGINLLPLAGEMRAWMQQRGQLSTVPTPAQPTTGGYTNPHAVSGVTLQLLMGRVVNASHEYATTQTPGHDELDAEVERIRLYNEVLIYSARFCEVAIKQLLYCTQIPESRFDRMAIGALLESPCPDCKPQNNKKPHPVSLVGTLAHPFHLCREFEQCAMDHMNLVNRLRNAEAAHAGVQHLNIRTVEASKAQLMQDSHEVLNGFVHMLSHLESLEHRTLADLTEKATAINLLKSGGLAAADCNFNLVPGQKFVFDPPDGRKPNPVSCGADSPAAPPTRRSLADVREVAQQVIGYVRAHPGQRLEEIECGLGTEAAVLKLAVEGLVASGQLRTEDQKRGTKYFAGGKGGGGVSGEVK